MATGKGGKNRRRGKNENEETKRELEFKEAGQEYAQVPTIVVVVVVFTLETIPVSLSSTSFSPNLCVVILVQHLTPTISVVTG